MLFLIEPRLYYIMDYYDVPLSGLCLYNNETYYFEFIHEEIYGLFKLHEEDKYSILRQKKDFDEMVGSHWSFNKDTGKKEQQWYTPTGRETEYYSIYQDKQTFKKKLIGQFLEFENY